MHVALINPPLQRNLGQIGDNPPYPSLSLGYLTSYLKKNDIDTLLVDAVFDKLSYKEVENKLKSFQPDLIGFTSMTHRIKETNDFAKKLRSHFPNAQFIIGGSHATVDSNILKEFEVFDIAVVGEGEEILLDIIKRKSKGVLHSNIIENLDLLPFPDFTDIKHIIETYPLLTSRGCPFQCVFCCRILGNKLRTRSPPNILEEIIQAKQKYHPRTFHFIDDQITIPRNRIMELCELLILKNVDIKWQCCSRVNTVDKQLLMKMKEAGCYRVDFGVESGNDGILKIIKKGITTKESINAVNIAKNVGLEVSCYFIIGHPYETVKTIKNTIDLAVKLNPNHVSFGIMCPYPQTEVYEMAKKGEGNYRLISNNWSDFDKQLGNALELTNLSRHELEKFQIKAYLYFYLKNYRFIDLTKLLFSYKKLAFKMVGRLIK